MKNFANWLSSEFTKILKFLHFSHLIGCNIFWTFQLQMINLMTLKWFLLKFSDIFSSLKFFVLCNLFYSTWVSFELKKVFQLIFKHWNGRKMKEKEKIHRVEMESPQMKIKKFPLSLVFNGTTGGSRFLQLNIHWLLNEIFPF